MSAVAAQAPLSKSPSGRHVARHPLAVPIDLTISRSGVPQSVPGRTLDVGEGGLGAVLAADLRPGDSVGIELRLPDVGLGLRAKAVIRHQAELRYGLEFLGLSAEQLAMLRYWMNRAEETQVRRKTAAQATLASLGSAQVLAPPAAGVESRGNSARRMRMLRVVFGIAFLSSVLIAGAGWWQWHRAWRELEARIPERLVTASPPHARVAADVMQQLLTYKVEPVYPASALQQKLEGVVVLDVAISADGRVGEVRPLSGPSELAPAAVDAVRWWRFQPYFVKGHPAQVDTTLAIVFRPES